jgi:transglutaminase superfamily protein
VRRSVERAGAAAAVVFVPLLLALVPLPAVLAVCDHWPRLGDGRASPDALASRARRWLKRGRGPWTSSCLTRSLVLYAMLRQHGHRPRLHVGVEGDSRAFAAHAWVTLDGRPIEQPPGVGTRFRSLVVHGG